MKPRRNDSSESPRWGARGVIAGIATAVAMIAAPTGASAASSLYAPDQGARTFAHGQASWSESSDSAGTCVELVLCPQITNSYEAGGGADEDGFIRTEIGSLTGVGGTSTGTWSSPSFVYDGNEGVRPDSLELSLARRADVSDLLRVDDNAAGFTVKLVSISSPADTVSVIDDRSLAGADDWSRIRDISIDPSQLTVGDKYRIEIATTYHTGVTVVPGGSADYDDVVLRAGGVADTTAGNNGGGNGGDGQNGGNGNGGNGGGGNGGGGGNTNATLAGSGVAGNAAALVKNGRLLVKLRCARKAGGTCHEKITGLLSKHGAKVGKARRVNVRSGKSRTVAIHVKPSLRSKLSESKRVFVRQRITAAHNSKTKVVKLKLRHG
jgi:hypothetical protein